MSDATKNNGGPAFPVVEALPNGGSQTISDGMTLRDYFAAKALNGILANESMTTDHEAVAYHAYEYADAMLAERSR